MSLLFGVKTVVDSNRGLLETCRWHVSTRGGLPAGRRIHLIYCLLTPWAHVHVKASKMSLTQTVTQMRIGAESTGQFLPGAFGVCECSFLPDPCLRGHESANLSCCVGLHVSCSVAVSVKCETRRVVTQHT